MYNLKGGRESSSFLKNTQAMIRCNKIRKCFGELEVLKGIDFEAAQGEVVSIVGTSGAGKSTLLQIMGTLMEPTDGSVEIDGVTVSALKGNQLSDFRNRKIGFVFQFHHLLPEFTAVENVMMPALIAKSNGSKECEWHSKSDSQIREEAVRLLTELGLGERITHKPSELSGGEQQRVAIARALINKPAVLFADEPSGNLDSKTKEELHNLFFTLRDKYGQTIIIVTHDKDLAQRSDRVVEMKDGRFI